MLQVNHAGNSFTGLLQNDVNLAALAATCTDRPWLPASAEAYA